ncbi:BTAD domain-containing putative transcriptional regulator [Promicromonospora sp. MEB111]|uniref:AfsR/SARP family transcriptional regulator n=1 Tax=Promicromonospora sp. MEB111 TaxID=3040301 RepID=UPI00254A2120|nr:BTAD domain-containing putative transcriptional regulator [Promicromonospora sp. MEB111]
MQHVDPGPPTGALGEHPVVAVLGPVAVLSDAGPVAPRGTRAAALVVLLALAAPRTVTVSALVDALWADDLPANPRAALQSLVSRLRSLRPDVVRFTSAGYALGGPSDLDRARAAVTEARELLGSARVAGSDGGAAHSAVGIPGTSRGGVAAAAVVDAALALWRGEPGDGLDDATPGLAQELRDTAGRLRDELTTLRRRAAAAAGDAATVTVLGSTALAADPLDEDAARDLMTALTATGRPDEASRVFGRLRHALVAELGTDPAPDLVALHARVAAAASGVDSTAGTTGTSGTASVQGVDGAPPTAVEPPPAAGRTTAGRFVRGLRAAATPLIGRADDVRAVVGELTRHRLVTILGAGGLGKTRLAQEVARTVAEDRATTPSDPLDGLSIAVAELAGVRTDDDVALAIADGLGVSAVGSARLSDRLLAGDLHDRIVERARTARTLLVLDNCEHVPDGAARWADVLLSAAPGLRILTTSRAPLQVAAEQVYPLAPLASGGARGAGSGTGRGPAAELFRQRALAARPGAQLPDAVVARLCDRLDGLPLAIELAAARVRTLSVEEIERHLDARFALLRGGDRTVPDRHRTLEAVIEWSWNLLEPSQRELWRRVSVLPDGLSAHAAAALGRLVVDPAAGASAGTAAGAAVEPEGEPAPGPGDVPPEGLVPLDVLDDIDGLVTQSLLVVEENPGLRGPGGGVHRPAPVRYRMLETVREFGLLRLAEAGEDDAVRDALLSWGMGVARWCTSRLLGPEQVAAVDLLRREHENLLFTIRQAARAGRQDVVVHGFVALGGAWTLRGAEERAADLAPAVLDAVTGRTVPAADADVTALALAYAAATTAFSGITGNLRALARLRRVLRDHGDAVGPRTRAVASMLLAPAPGAVLELRGSDDPLIAFLAHLVASQEAENAGRLDEALDGAERAYHLAQGIGDVASRAGAAMFLATTAFGAGDTRTAKHWSRVAREGLTVIGADGAMRQLDWVDLGTAITDGDLAGAERICARVERAGQDADQSERGGDESRAVVRAGRAEIAWAQGDVAGALDLYEQAVNVFADLPGVADDATSAGPGSPAAPAVGPPPAGRGDPSPAAPWAVIVGSAWIVRLVDAGHDVRARQVADVVRRRAVRLYREWMRHVADHPVLGTVCLAVGAVLTAGPRPDAAVGLELLALAEALGSRQDFMALRRDPVLAAAADRHGADAVAAARARIAAISREDLAEHALTTLENLSTAELVAG